MTTSLHSPQMADAGKMKEVNMVMKRIIGNSLDLVIVNPSLGGVFWLVVLSGIKPLYMGSQPDLILPRINNLVKVHIS